MSKFQVSQVKYDALTNTFWELVLIKSPMLLRWRNAEVKQWTKHTPWMENHHRWQDILLEKKIDLFDKMYSEALYYKETYS